MRKYSNFLRVVFAENIIVVSLVIVLCFPSILLSQEQFSGIVVTPENEPIPFANIALLNKCDSSIIAGTTSDSLGVFVLKCLKDSKDPFIRVSCLGYKTLMMSYSKLKPLQGRITLKEDVKLLADILVKGINKEYVSYGNSGVSISIDDMHLSSHFSARELLKQLPLVEFGPRGFKVIGRSGTPVIYINNRKISRLDSELNSLKTRNIDRIDIVLNPGAEYAPSVTSVIRITTKGNIDKGVYGGIYNYTEKGKHLSYYSQAQIGWQQKGVNLFINTDFYQKKSDEKQVTNQNILSLNSHEKTFADLDFIYKELSYSIGCNFDRLDRVQFGVEYEYSRSPETEDTQFLADTIIVNDEVLDSGFSKIKNFEKGNRHRVSGYGDFNIGSRKLLTSFNLFVGEDKEITESKINYHLFNRGVNSNNSSDYLLLSSKAIFSTPALFGKIKSGIEYALTRHDYEFIMATKETNIPSTYNNTTQNLISLFSTYKKSIKDLTINVGGRIDAYFNKVIFDNNSKNEDKSSNRMFAPIMSVALNLNETSEFEFGYKRVVSKPSYYSLRNNVSFHTPYLYESGNPLLKDEYTDKYYANYRNGKHYFELYFRSTNNFRSLVFDRYYVDEPVIIVKPVNIGRLNSVSILASSSYDFGKFLFNGSIAFSQQFLEYEMEKYNTPLVNVNIKGTYHLSTSFDATLKGFFNTNGNSRLSYVKDDCYVNFSIRKAFLKKKLNLSIYVEDIFNSSTESWALGLSDINVLKYNKKDTRRIGFVLSLDFDSAKGQYKGNRSSSEIDRL